MELTLAHWIYLVGMIVIVGVMIAKKNVVVPAVAATLLTAWAFTGSFVTGLTSIFMASLVAAAELFSIFLIIALVTSLLNSLKAAEADRWLVLPFRVMIRNAITGYFVLFGATFFISLFFWPTPAVPLIGAILLPVAIRAGLPPMIGAMVIAIAGQGMALSSDYVIQVAPGLSAAAAGVNPGDVADRALIMSVITGVIALTLVLVMNIKSFKKPSEEWLTEWEARAGGEGTVFAGAKGSEEDRLEDREILLHADEAQQHHITPHTQSKLRAQLLALLTAVAFAALVAYMLLGKFTDIVPEVSGSSAAGLVGGTAAMVMLIAAFALNAREALEAAADHVVDGLVFAFKAMGIVIPIAGFFFMGNNEFAGSILGLDEETEAPGFLFDLVESVGHLIPEVPIAIGIGLLLVGIATGLDGSGFSGLPLTGALAGSFSPATGVSAETLAAIGQIGAIWTGGGTLIAWSSLIAVAGICRVSVIDLARKLMIPVVIGMLVAAIAGVLILG